MEGIWLGILIRRSEQHLIKNLKKLKQIVIFIKKLNAWKT